MKGSILILLCAFTYFVDACNKKDNNIHWQAAAEGVENGDTGVIDRFLDYQDIDAEGSYRISRNVTMLEVAAYVGNLDAIQQLLQADPKPNINHKDEYGWSALSWAASEGHLEVVKTLLQVDEININILNSDGWSALHNAVRSRQLEVVKLLLQIDELNINTQNDLGMTPVMTAVYLSRDTDTDTEIVQALLQRPDVNLDLQANYLMDEYPGYTALDLAKKEGYTDIVKLLQDKNAACYRECWLPNQTRIKPEYITWEAAAAGVMIGETGVIEMFLAYNDIDTEGSYGVQQFLVTARFGMKVRATMLIVAADVGNLYAVEQLLQADPKPDVNRQVGDGIWSAILLATRAGHSEVVKRLLQVDGIDINSQNKLGWTVLDLAKKEGYTDIVKLLQDKNAACNKKC